MAAQLEPDTVQSDPAIARHSPPAPAWLFRFINPLMKALLRSPFHRRLSGQLMVLNFIGQKSGKAYSIPVGYTRLDDQILILTHSPWWHNFRHPAPVSGWVQGRQVKGTAQVVRDPVDIRRAVQALLKAQGEARARQLGYWVPDPQASPEEIARQVQGTIFIAMAPYPDQL